MDDRDNRENHPDPVAVIGLGYVGLPLALLLVKKGFKVYGIDRDSKKIKMLRQGKSYLSDLQDEELGPLQGKRFVGTTHYDVIRHVKTCILCVPTPLRERRYPDLSYLQSAGQELVKYMQPGQLIILESTTFPGTTEEVLLSLLSQNGQLTAGEDFYLGYSPERVDPGNKSFELENIPKVVSGVTERCVHEVTQVYSRVFRTLVPVRSPRVAEMTKILENCQRFVNISFMNEVAMLCHEMNIDIWDVIEAARTKPYGFTAFYPGPGIGGHCIPVDPLYLAWKAEQYQFDTRFIGLAKQINDRMPRYIVERIKELIGKPLAEGRLLVIGLTYKKDVNDLRESTALAIFEELVKAGVDQLDYFDPYLEKVEVDGEHYQGLKAESIRYGDYDASIILTDHTDLPYQTIIEQSQLVFDTRGTIEGSYKHVKRL